MIEIEVKCPHCGKSLMDEDHKIDDAPSIGLVIVGREKMGWLRLSSLYGSYSIESEFPTVEKELYLFYCPHCNRSLAGPRVCRACEAPMVPLAFVAGGVVQFCSRRGCRKHLVEFEDLDTEMSAFYSHYSTFFKGK